MTQGNNNPDRPPEDEPPDAGLPRDDEPITRPAHTPTDGPTIMGSLPQVFTGDCTKATEFIEEVKGYIQLNQDVPGFNSPIKKAARTLTLIKGSEVAGWVRNMGHWIDQLNPTLDNVPFIWEQFLQEFARQFHDSQQQDRACIKLENLRMVFPDIDRYISQFEDLARQAGYTKGNPETMQLFLSGLDRFTLEGVLRPPFAHGYQAIKEHAIESTRSTQLVHSIIGQGPAQSMTQNITEIYADTTCFHCKQEGHIAHHCPTRRKQTKITNLIDIEEEIPSTSISPIEDVCARLASLTIAQQNQLAKDMRIQDPLHCLLRSALLRRNQDENVYISARKSMTVRFYIHSITKRAESVALLDSGATENFMNLSYAKWLRLPIKQLERTTKLFNTDGTENKSGELRYYTDLNVRTGHRTTSLHFFLTDLGDHKAILGYSWFTVVQPNIDWKRGWIDHTQLPIILCTPNAKRAVFTPRTRNVPREVVANQYFIGHVTFHNPMTSSTSNPRVPAEYQCHGKVFSEEESQHLHNTLFGTMLLNSSLEHHTPYKDDSYL